MDHHVKRKLLDINAQFYQTFAAHFSATRQRLQPGVHRVLQTIQPDESILDIGCGNGNLWRALAAQGHRAQYYGLDFSAELIELAKHQSLEFSKKHPCPAEPVYWACDLTETGWGSLTKLEPVDIITAFAVLHHIPGEDTRLEIMQRLRGMLRQNGRVEVSVWQFLNSSRLQSRIMDWSTVHLSEDCIDPGDYLLDWRSGGLGLRYVHHFDVSELRMLAHQSGFQIIENSYSDGKEGNLGLYQTWSVLN